MNAKADAAIQNEMKKTEARIAMDDARAAAEIRRKNAVAMSQPKPTKKYTPEK